MYRKRPGSLVLVQLSRRGASSWDEAPRALRLGIVSVLERHVAYNIIAHANLFAAGRLAVASASIARHIEYVLHAAYKSVFKEVSQCCSLEFYKVFWQLTLQSVLSLSLEPSSITVGEICGLLKDIEASDSSHQQHACEPRSLALLARDAERLGNLRIHTPMESSLRACLEACNADWLCAHHLGTTVVLTRYLIFPRILLSYSDALCCAGLVKLLISLRTPHFQFLDFCNTWIDESRGHLPRCSIQEAKHLGLFTKEMMSYVVNLRSSEKHFARATVGNPCFHLSYGHASDEDEQVSFEDCCNAHFKWEVRILDAMHQCYVEAMRSVMWKEIGLRRVLEFCSMAATGFPMLRRPAIATMTLVSKIKLQAAAMSMTEVEILAGNILAKLGRSRLHWTG
jgi:hypothetical protein